MSKTHEIDGKKYVEVERKAEVGEKVIDLSDGQIETVYRIFSFARDDFRSGVVINEDGTWIGDDEYRVLEPVEAESTAPDLVDIIANLSAEVTQLKRNHAEQLDTLFSNVQQLGEELASLQSIEKVDSTPVTLPKWMIDRLMGGYRG
ncbi:hypothetical protein DOE78_18945 [Bacillus sp. Y1]|nr:hypothetical protein [Bacillus sp. Y1]AYA77358.1 hypothetical protein DOE78_18945 [Bacillus sp. Y1]